MSALSRLHHDRADQIMQRALGSPHLLIRLEALYHLCQKRHSQVIDQIESLMYKTPSRLLVLYPALLVHIDTRIRLRFYAVYSIIHQKMSG